MSLPSSSISAENWKGKIPILITLAPGSLSSPTLPPPLHCLLSRHTFLHVGLEEQVRRLQKFAPPTFSFKGGVVQEPDPGSNVSHDETTIDKNLDASSSAAKDKEAKGEPDSSSKEQSRQNDNSKTKEEPYPVCWFEDMDTELPLPYPLFAGVLWDCKPNNQRSLPWRLQLHFRNYPTSQILELPDGQVEATLERLYKNSLKQALFLQHSNAKVAMNMTKQTHNQLWDAIRQAKYQLYRKANTELQSANIPSLLPVRLLLDVSKPMIQRRWALASNVKGDDTDGGDGEDKEESQSSNNNNTLGDLLIAWAPEYFHLSKKTDGDSSDNSIDAKRQWRVAGIQPPLKTPLVDLWRHLCHPDHFLYITVVEQGQAR